MVCVVTNTGKPLMPTTEYRARKLLKSGKAIIQNIEQNANIMLSADEIAVY